MLSLCCQNACSHWYLYLPLHRASQSCPPSAKLATYFRCPPTAQRDGSKQIRPGFIFGTLQHMLYWAARETMGGVGEALSIPRSACLWTMVTLCFSNLSVKSKYQHRNEARCLLKPASLNKFYRSLAAIELGDNKYQHKQILTHDLE